MNFPCEAVIIKIDDGLGFEKNDRKYIGPHLRKMVRLLHEFEDKRGMYLTDIFIPEFKDLNNDYIYHGFLIVSCGNIKIIE